MNEILNMNVFSILGDLNDIWSCDMCCKSFSGNMSDVHIVTHNNVCYLLILSYHLPGVITPDKWCNTRSMTLIKIGNFDVILAVTSVDSTKYNTDMCIYLCV